jgi:hypothetical protein
MFLFGIGTMQFMKKYDAIGTPISGQLRLSEEVIFSKIAKRESGHASIEAKVMVPDNVWVTEADTYGRIQVEKELYRIRIHGYEIDGPIMADYRPGEIPHYLVNLVRKKKN